MIYFILVLKKKRKCLDKKKSLITVLKLVALAVIFWFISSKINMSDLEDIKENGDLFQFFLSMGLYFGSIFFAALQWKNLLKIQEVKIKYLTSLRFSFVGVFFNSFLPSSTGGDVYRVYGLGKDTSKWGSVLSATFFDRVFGFVVLGFFSFVAGVVFFDEIDLKFSIIVLSLFFSLISGFLLFIASHRFCSLVDRFIFSRFPAKIVKTLREFRLEGKKVFSSYKSLLPILVTSILVQGMRVLSNYYAAKSIGVDIDVGYFFLFIPIIGMAISLPITFGGVGIREIVSLELFGSLGVANYQAVFMQTVAFIANVFVNLLGGLVLLYRMFKDKSR